MANPFVRKLAACGELTSIDMLRLEAACQSTHQVPAHRDLIREGDEPNSMFIVLSGWAHRYKVLPDGSRQIVAFLMPGDFCDIHVGELDAMDHSVGTLTPCVIATLPRLAVEELIIASPRLSKAFVRAQLIDQGVMRAWIISIGRRSAAKGLSHLMLELFFRMRTIGLTTDGSCEMPLTQAVLADALGLTAVHTNRIVRQLRIDGVLTIAAKRLSIPDVSQLARLAGFDDKYLHMRLATTR
jgi:CRP-like cAMP-binding protein